MAWLPWDTITAAVQDLWKSAVAVAGTWLVMRVRVAKVKSAVVEEQLGTGVLRNLTKQRDDMQAEREAMKVERDAVLKSATEAAKAAAAQQLTQAVQIAQLQLRLEGCDKESTACQERAMKAEVRAAAAEEHERSQAEELMLANVRAQTMHMVLQRLDPSEAERFTADKWKGSVAS